MVEETCNIGEPGTNWNFLSRSLSGDSRANRASLGQWEKTCSTGTNWSFLSRSLLGEQRANRASLGQQERSCGTRRIREIPLLVCLRLTEGESSGSGRGVAEQSESSAQIGASSLALSYVILERIGRV